MSMGKGGNTSTAQVELSPEQRQQIAAQTELFTKTLAPTLQQTIAGATNLYNQAAPGVTNAAQKLSGTASQIGQTLGETGESATRTGIKGLESLFSPEYAQQQLQAALAPAQAQYQQNIANQQAQFGGMGNLGSARDALARTQLAGQTQASQQAAAAGILKDIEAQRAQAATNLAQMGSGQLGQALGAAGQQVSAAMTPVDLFSKYASVIFGTPSSSYNPDFRGTQGTTTTGSQSNFGIKI